MRRSRGGSKASWCRSPASPRRVCSNASWARQGSMVNNVIPQETPASAPVPRKRGRAIVVTSGKGGVGKTTTTANLGLALASRGARVVLIDADVGLRNLDLVLGLESRVRYHLLDVLEASVELEEALVRDKRVEGLFLLAAAQSR